MNLGLRIALTVLFCISARAAHAQPGHTEVILTDSEMSNDALEILHGALEREGIALRRSDEAAACSGKLDESSDSAVRARVWLHWSEHIVTLCFQDRCQSSERVLGHFAQLDARAREEILTVISSGLAALPLACPARSAPAPAPLPEEPPNGPARVDPAPLTNRLPAAEQPARPSPPAAAPTEPTPAIPRRPQLRASEPPSAQYDPRHAAVNAEDNEDTGPSQRKLLFSARYGITRWSVDVLSQHVGAGAAYALHRYPIFAGVELDYAPAFRVREGTVGLDVSSLRLAVQLWARWSLSRQLVLDAQFGPALDWLWLTPQAATAGQLRDPRSSAHADPAVFARIGPALRVYKALLLGVDMQLDAAFIARSYGFSADAGPREVFSPDRVRMSIALHARAEL